MSDRTKLLKTIMAMAEIYGRTMGVEAAELYLDDLEYYPPAAVQEALKRCRKELPRFPTISDIIARIDDGRPGADEAWAMVPKDEYQSVCWTEEMTEAYYACSSLIGSDDYAARQAFREKYLKLISDARAQYRPVEWSISFGQDKNHRETVLLEATQKKRIELDLNHYFF